MSDENIFEEAIRRWRTGDAGDSDHIGVFYLHTNGDLIYKRWKPNDSDFVKRVWPFLPYRSMGWLIAIEALALGARRERIWELKELWGLTDEDGLVFAGLCGLKLWRAGDLWLAAFDDFVNVQESQFGWGMTALEAFANLARQGLMG